MNHFADTSIADRLSLSDADISTLRAALPALGGTWSVLTEAGDDGDVYARLLPPWGDQHRSAFLVEREDKVVILTDNLSEPNRCRISGHPSVGAAMEAVRRVVVGDARR